MRSDRFRISILAVVAWCGLPHPTSGQTVSSTDAAIAELRQLLVEQRAALDRQARVIEEQSRTLAALRQRVDELTPSDAARMPVRAPGVPAAAEAEIQTPQTPPATRTAAAPSPDLPTDVVSAGDFPGSIRMPGTDSAFKLGGQARMVSVHTLAALGTDDRFVTSSIPVGVPRAGEDARTTYSPAASRLSTDLRMNTPEGPMRTFIETDFAGDGSTMRLRHAFLQTNHFVVGQTWSTFSDPEAEPIGIDFEGLNAISLFRQPQFRWTTTLGSRYQLAVALENPAPDLTGAQGVNLTPDAIVRLKWVPERKHELFAHAAHVQASIIIRQLRGQVSTQPGETPATGGIGGSVSGVLVPKWDAHDRIKFAGYVGSGIGRYITDLRSLGGQDAVYDPTELTLRALSVSSGYIGYERAWSHLFTTAVTYGVVVVNNLDIQTDDALHRTQRTSVNLTWSPIPPADIIFEFLAGTRTNRNGDHGASSQFQAGWTLRF